MAKQVIVAGAGASGLMAAIFAARGGASVTVLESMDRPGKKLLMTGNGRCNLTNMDERLPYAYHGAETSFVDPVIRQFDAAQTRAFFCELGLLTIEKNGYVYPYTNQASSVLEVLLAEVRRLGIRLKLTEKITAIHQESGCWQVRTATWTYQAERLILSCGSKCAPGTGSDGSSYSLAERIGLKVTPVSPALVPLICEESFLPRLAGVRCQAAVSLFRYTGPFRKKQTNVLQLTREKSCVCLGRETGEIQWTKYGISGIAVFQLSRFAASAAAGEQYFAVLDLFAPFSQEEIAVMLQTRAQSLAKEKAAVLLYGLLPEKLIPVVLERAGISLKQRCSDLKEETLTHLLETCRSFSLSVTGTKAFDVCQVCAGGIDTGQLVPETMECRELPGLYVTGEALDVDGPCGGYNLQWAWSSGYVAGTNAAR